MKKRMGRKGSRPSTRRCFSRQGRRGKRERQEAKVQKPSEARSDALRIGELRLHRDGYGFVVSAVPNESDAFIPAQYVGDALHTDLVEVRVVPGRGGKLEGRITRIVERRVLSLMGRLERQGGSFQVIADDRRVRHRILVSVGKTGGARHGDNVIVRIAQYPSSGHPMQGEVVEVLGTRGEEATEKAAVIARHQLRREFPPPAVKEADAVYRLMNEEVIRSRRDLRDHPFVTIDGETAKDFDDAVAAERIGGGIIRLWVSIADVSWFVHPHSALDRAAFERGTSVYFPGDCLPMLPEPISNELCSLKPHIDRLTVTAEMDIDADGAVVRREFYRSVIQSRERMTYTAVRQILVDRDAAVRDRYRKLVPMFEVMEECHHRLRGRRQRQGSIDFDLPEPEIVIDLQGVIADIVRAERHVGHMMIEDFMIAANEAVAEFLTERRTGCLYRIHEPPPPDKLTAFALLLHNLGHRFCAGRDASPGALAKVVDAVRGRPEERLVNHMLLRSMSQAVYSPENKGHFGLASRCYCHFTSPIRRYPDLIVHRLLTAALSDHGGGAISRSHERVIARGLQDIADHCSRRERVAMEAERETAKLYAAFFMKEKVGEVFSGVISHMTKFGFFVELIEYFVEGVVFLETMDDDRYRFIEEGMMIAGSRKKKTYRIGDLVRVEVEEVDVANREIVFVPV